MAEHNSSNVSNCFGNASHPKECLRGYMESLEFKIIKMIFYAVVFLLSTTGNCMVVGIILRSQRMREVGGNFLILNLAICDLLTPFISIPFDIGLEENRGVWPYKAGMCKILFPITTMTSTCSSLTLAAISFDRYRSLMHPFKSRLTTMQVKVIIITLHVVAFVLILPYANALELHQSECTEVGWKEFFYRQLYTVALFVVQYLLPLVFMAVMYVISAYTLHRSTDKVQSMAMELKEKPNGERGSSVSCLSMRESFLIRREHNMKVTKMFMVIVAVFAICMFPNGVVWLWADFGSGLDNRYFSRIAIICRLFTYTNSCMNPFIYAIYHKDFREGFRSIIGFVCCQKETDIQRLRRIWGNETSRMTQNKSGKGAISAIGNFHTNVPLGEAGRSRSVVSFNFDKENSSNVPRIEVTRRAYSAQNSPVSILKSSKMNCCQCQSAVSGLNSSNAANLSVDGFRLFKGSSSLKIFNLKNGNFEKRTHCESSSDGSLSDSSDKSAVLFKRSRNDPSTELLRAHVLHRKENSFHKPITQLA